VRSTGARVTGARVQVLAELLQAGEALAHTELQRRLEQGRSNEVLDRVTLYRAYLEGVAYTERWILELVESLGAEVKGPVRATGGGAKSKVWMQIRADVLNRPIARPAITESAMGAAIVAASRTAFGSLGEASAQMARMDLQVGPDAAKAARCEELYQAFRAECVRRGYS
jgi:sugar (pentulose or hexulose) kinase